MKIYNATHRVSPAGRRPPAAGKLAVGAARRIDVHGLERQLQAPLAPKLSTGLTAGQGTQAPRTAHEGNFCRDNNVH